MWVRGLKLINRENNQFAAESHPMWVRGLKPNGVKNSIGCTWSHPMWVRGLKLTSIGLPIKKVCRTLCGCVD